jgi:hypothetical protein
MHLVGFLFIVVIADARNHEHEIYFYLFNDAGSSSDHRPIGA